MKAKISIITVVYNSLNTIERTILSVIRQTYDNIEYVIIDGKSTDGTVDIIKKYSDYIDVFVSEPDSGIYDAMNKGIRLATGDAIAFLNSDDWYEPDTVQNAANLLNKSGFTGLVCGNIILEDCLDDKREVQSDVSGDFWFGNIILHPTLFSSKKVFDDIGMFDCKYRIAADYKWMSKAMMSGYKFLYSEIIKTHFSLSGISSVNDLKTIEESFQVVSELMSVSDVPKEKRNKILNHWYYRRKMCIFRLNVQSNPNLLFDQINNLNSDELPLVIWGTGFYGRFLSEIFINDSIVISCFIDSDSDKQGLEINGIRVNDPSFLDKGIWYVIIAIDQVEDELEGVIKRIELNNNQYITVRRLCDDIFLNNSLE